MKLSEWAKRQGITYKTAWRWFKAGALPLSNRFARLLCSTSRRAAPGAPGAPDFSVHPHTCAHTCMRGNGKIGRIRRNVAHWSVVSVLPLITCICGPNSHPSEPALVTMWAIVKTLWLEPLPLKYLVE